MLIRTPPEQVLPVYKKFVDKYPKLEDLYRAELDDIEKTIKSLGFKWRAKRLKRMAEYIIEKTNGKFPCNLKELKRVPGIGEYTAAAILTFSYKKRAVPVDSNTVRFFKRFYNYIFTGEARRNKDLIKNMDELIPGNNFEAIIFNTSFLDFMRKICSPRLPECTMCPLYKKCKYGKNMKEIKNGK